MKLFQYDHSVTVIREEEKEISLYKLAIPLFMEQIFLLMYGTINTVLLSGYSDIAVTATSVAQQVIGMASVVIYMITKGTVILTSIAIGSKDRKYAEQVCGSGSVLAVAISIVFIVAFKIFAGPLITLMNLEGEGYQLGVEYLETLISFFTATAVMSFLNNMLITNGHSNWAMVSGLSSNVLNLVLSYFALYSGVEFGISGVKAVALCNGISQVVGTIIAAYFFVRTGCPYKLAASIKQMLKILHLGVPAGMCMFSYNAVQTFSTGIVAGLGTMVCNTKVYISNIVSYTARISASLGSANAILTGRYRGSGEFEKIKILYKQNLFISLAANMTLSAIVLLFHRPLLSIFTDSEAIFALALPVLAIDFIVEISRAVNHITENSLNANGDVKVTLIVSTIMGWLCGVCIAYVLAVVLEFGLVGIWIASALEETGKAFFYVRRWKSNKWTGGFSYK